MSGFWSRRGLLRILIAYCAAGLPGGATLALAEERLELEQTNIVGVQELPRVVHILSWRITSPEAGTPPLRSLIDEPLAPLDREEFRRQLQYRERLERPVQSP